jgi:hypothetical protein
MLLGRVDNQHRHVRIVVSEPSMFGNFRFAVRINCPVNWLHNMSGVRAFFSGSPQRSLSVRPE